MRLAKDRLDVGLITDDRSMLEFMSDEVGLGEAEVLPVTKTITQHRFDVDGSVIKVNVVDSELDTDRRSGYSEVIVADAEASEPRRLVGPDGVVVTVAPPGHAGVDQLGVRLRVADLGLAQGYFADTLGWEVEGTVVRLGATVVLLDPDSAAPTTEMPVRGWTYLTVQIHDCDAETAAAVAGGATLAQSAVTLGEVARFSMVADPWGNQLELSQRASLTGPLPTAEPPPPSGERFG